MSLYKKGKARALLAVYLGFFVAGIFLTLGEFTTKVSFYEWGQIFGTLSLTGLALQLWMGARVKFIEEGVGLDKIMRFHSLNGKLTFLFVLLHPLFIFVPLMLGGLPAADIVKSYTIFHWMGISAFWLIILTLITTLYQASLKINYEHWKIIHRVGYLIIFLGFTHALFAGSDIVTRGPLYYWWWFLMIMTVGAVVYRYGVRNIALRDNLYKVINVVKESPDVRSIVMEPIGKKVMSYFPGQFAFVRFYSQSVPSEEHHFTLSSYPQKNSISFTVKELGDYTKMLGSLKKGDTARIEGPFGVFSNEGMTGPFVFIAGGIGITPIMSMVRAMRDSGKKENALLIYAAKTESELVFKKELDELAKKAKWFRVVYKVGDHVDSEFLKKEVKDFNTPKFFICGPNAMMKSIEKLLLENGTPKEVIFTEKFSLK